MADVHLGLEDDEAPDSFCCPITHVSRHSLHMHTAGGVGNGCLFSAAVMSFSGMIVV